MKKRSKFLSALPLVLALGLLSSSAAANSSYSNRRAPRTNSRYSASYGSGFGSKYNSGYCAPRPRYSGYRAPKRVWVPGHYELREHQVWFPGNSQEVWRPARFETRFRACGTAFQFQISAGYYETVFTPGRYETRTKRVWCAGRWSH